MPDVACLTQQGSNLLEVLMGISFFKASYNVVKLERNVVEMCEKLKQLLCKL